MRSAEKPAIQNPNFAMVSGPDADNKLDDSQVVLRLRRFKNCDASNSKKCSVGSPAAIQGNQSTDRLLEQLTALRTLS